MQNVVAMIVHLLHVLLQLEMFAFICLNCGSSLVHGMLVYLVDNSANKIKISRLQEFTDCKYVWEGSLGWGWYKTIVENLGSKILNIQTMIDRKVNAGFDRDGLTPLEIEGDTVVVLLGEAGRDFGDIKAWDLTSVNATPVLSDEMAGTDLRGLSTWKLSSNDFTSLPILPFSKSDNSLATQ